MYFKEQKLLSDIYENYLKTGNRTYSIRFSNTAEKHELYPLLDNLNDDGYIEYITQAIGMCTFKITSLGIQFAQNGYQEIDVSPVVQGANSIFINGSGNNVANNYNQISVEIEQTDLPEDYKQLIKTFLQEIKSPDLSTEKKSNKIQSFLSDISSGTISGIASSGLTALISALLNRVPF